MPNLPSLQTGSTVQYPFVTSLKYSTEIIRFVDGSEQRFSQSGNVHRAWNVEFRDLTPSETEAIAAFVEDSTSTNQEFAFHDPVTGEVHSHCRLAAERVPVQHAGEKRSNLWLTIKEVG